MSRSGMTAVNVSGVVSQGAAITNVVHEWVEIPADRIEPHELLYRIGWPPPYQVGLLERDLVVVEGRSDGHSATAELVIATLEDVVFVGRWWGKHHRRAVIDESLEPIAEDARLCVIAVINVVIRPRTPLDSSERT